MRWFRAVTMGVGAVLGSLGVNSVMAGPLPLADAIVVHKAARVLELYSAGHLFATIPHIQLGARPLGAKHFQGDQRTPEGHYTIDFGNDHSAYHLALHISYPGPADRGYAQAAGRSPGGDVFIHGQPGDWPAGRVPGDWTAGCIALSNAEIELLWQTVPDGTPINIEP